VLELHLKKLPEVEQMGLQQDALLLVPVNNHFRKPPYFIDIASIYRKERAFITLSLGTLS
jgi:hypothetical protein